MSAADSGSPVSNGCSSPLSPDPLLDSSPLSLDFDPMSFQFKECSSPTQEDSPLSPKVRGPCTSTQAIFDPFATISPDESDLAFETMTNIRESHFDPLSNVTPEEPDLPVDPFGIMSAPFIPEEFQNAVEEEFLETTLPKAVHDTLGPDILENAFVGNTNNPDVVLIDTQQLEENNPDDNLISDFETVTNDTNSEIVRASCVENSVFVQDGSSHVDNLPVVNVLEHDQEVLPLKNGLMIVEEEALSGSESLLEVRRKPAEAEFSSRSTMGGPPMLTTFRITDSSNKRLSALNKKKTSASSETSLSEKNFPGKASPKKTLTEHNSVEQKVTVNSKIETTNESIKISSMESKNDLQIEEYENCSSSSSDEEEVKPIQCPISIQKLRTQYVQQVEHESLPSPTKEVISTGIDLQVLKTSFNKTTEDLENFPSVPVEEVKPSVDRAQVTRKFSQRGNEDGKSLCRICNKHVFQMEKIKAEKSIFHKDCFKCKECGKKLTVDIYSSHERELYCKPHFKQLFQPKSQFGGEDTAPRKQRRNEMLICENTPIELPPDVVRSETKTNDFESLSSFNLLNIKSRFESQKEELHLPSTSDICTLQRSPSLMARMARYQSAVSGDHINGDLPGEDEIDRDATLKETKHKEKAVQDSKNPITQGESVVLGRDVKALSIKEKFEKGAVDKDDEIEAERQERIRREKEEDLSCFVEPGTADGARSLFKQMDAVATNIGVRSPGVVLSPMKSSSTVFQASPQHHGPLVVADIVKCSAPTEKDDIHVETVQISEKFRFFEKYQEPQKEKKRFQITPPRETTKEDTPDKEVARDPSIVRCSDIPDDGLPATDTAKKMLNKFKALESQAENPVPVPSALKPLKRITPPRDSEHKASSPEPFRQPDPDIIRCSYKAEEDVSLVEADKAKSLKAKFENWTTEVVRENMKNEKQLEGGSGGEEDYLPQADMTKTLRAMFESIKDTDPVKAAATDKPKPKVSRFIDQQQQMANGDVCASCEKRIYPMEKLEASGMKLHKNCFRCAHCNCVLRLENYTTSGGKLFCVTHFKQLFISKGNYDEGFGREQHKEKWNRSRSNTPTPREDCTTVSHSFTEKTSEVAI